MVEHTEVQAEFKETEVGMVPFDWSVKPLKELVRITSGFSFSSQFFSAKGPILLTPGNFKLKGGLYFNERNTKHFSGDYNSSVILRFGDLLIVMTDLTPECNLLGKPAFVEISEIILHNQRIGKIEIRESKLLDKYLYWIFLSESYLNRIKGTATGSTVRHTSNNSVFKINIPLPPTLAEQTAIATALNDADALITQLENLIAKKRAIKQGAMQELLKPKEGWKVKRLGEIVERIVGGGTPSRSNGSYWGNEIPWVTVKDFATFDPFSAQEFITREGLKNSASNLIPKGTLITSTRMAVGKAVTYQVDVSINQDLKAIFPKPSLDTLFLFYWFQSNEESISELGSGSTVMGITLGDLRSIEFNLPPLEEQKVIAQTLSDVDKEIEILEKKLAKYQQVKQGMMQNLLTGKIRLV